MVSVIRIGTIFSIATAAFLVFYGVCLIGHWPIDVTRGIGLLERRSTRTRRIIGAVLVAAGAVTIYLHLAVG